MPSAAVSEHTLLNAAIRWASYHTVDFWTYQELNYTPNKIQTHFKIHSTHCYQAQYETKVHMPSKFLKSLSFSDLTTNVNKYGCVHGQDVYDITELHSLPMIDSITILYHTKFIRATEKVHHVSILEMTVPWYLSALYLRTSQHVNLRGNCNW